MAFTDLEEALAELFSNEDRLADGEADWALAKRRHNAAVQRARVAEDRINARLDRKRARAMADRAMPPPLPLSVSCALCRESFYSPHGLPAHYRQRHPGVPAPTAQNKPLDQNLACCRWCREPFAALYLLPRHTSQAHPAEHARAVAQSLLLTAANARSHRSRCLPALSTVRVIPRVNARVAYSKRFAG